MGVFVVTALLLAQPAPAQTTGTPSFNAPYRAFGRHEFGATLSFPRGGGTAAEGQYRFGYRTVDVGLRGGVFFPSGASDNRVLVGALARNRVLTHRPQFPLDGAVVLGGGLSFNGGTGVRAIGGLSLGRRIDLENSPVSIIPYAQPSLFLTNVPAGVGRDTKLDIGVGFGADFRLSEFFDARISVGIGNGPEGVSLSAVWLR